MPGWARCSPPRPQQYRSADLGRAEPAIRDIAVWDAGGNRASAFRRPPPIVPCAQPQFAGPRTSFPGGLAFLERHANHRGAVRSPSTLGSHRTALIPLRGASRLPTARSRAPVPGWPLAVMTSVDEKNVLAGWAQTLPLYLFVILGPALAGGWLAALFVGAFERHAKASQRHPRPANPPAPSKPS